MEQEGGLVTRRVGWSAELKRKEAWIMKEEGCLEIRRGEGGLEENGRRWRKGRRLGYMSKLKLRSKLLESCM